MDDLKKIDLIESLTSQLSKATRDFIIKHLSEQESFALVVDLIISSHIENMFNFLRYISLSVQEPEAQILTEKIIKKIQNLFMDLDLQLPKEQ